MPDDHVDDAQGQKMDVDGQPDRQVVAMLERAASSGEVRGAESVWSEASRAADRQTEPVSGRGRSLSYVAAVILVAFAAGFGIWAVADGRGSSTIDSPAADIAQERSSETPTSTTTTVVSSESSESGASSTPSPATDDDGAVEAGEVDVFYSDGLSVIYTDCVNELAGSEGIEGVGVFTDAAGLPLFVKTGRDVPTEYHVPCFTEIGGRPTPGESSWNPDEVPPGD